MSEQRNPERHDDGLSDPEKTAQRSDVFALNTDKFDAAIRRNVTDEEWEYLISPVEDVQQDMLMRDVFYTVHSDALNAIYGTAGERKRTAERFGIEIDPEAFEDPRRYIASMCEKLQEAVKDRKKRIAKAETTQALELDVEVARLNAELEKLVSHRL